MKDALSNNKAEQSALTTGALIITAGGLPSKLANVISEVLAHLLNGDHVTGLENVFNVSTAQMAVFIYCLEVKYGWTVERKKKVVLSKNGCMVLVSEYWIDPEVIFLAKAADADAWCAKVRAARSASRAKATDARRLPDRTNASILTSSYLQQKSLFDKEMGACHGPL